MEVFTLGFFLITVLSVGLALYTKRKPIAVLAIILFTIYTAIAFYGVFRRLQIDRPLADGSLPNASQLT